MSNLKVNSKTTLLEFKRKHNGLVDNSQEKLVSGENIKTIGSQSILGSGNIEVGGEFSLPYYEISSSNDYVDIGELKTGIYKFTGAAKCISSNFKGCIGISSAFNLIDVPNHKFWIISTGQKILCLDGLLIGQLTEYYED